LREASQNNDSVVCRLGGHVHGIAIDWVKARMLNLSQVADGSRDVIAKVMNNTFDRATVEEVAIGVGELGFEHPPHSPARDGVS
jgi:hypothetical protein